MKTRTTQQIIASFPAAIAVDLRGLHCATPFGVVHPGERGYQPVSVPQTYELDKLDEIVMRQYQTRKPTGFEREAALYGSMVGWDVPGADPEYLEANPPKNAKGV